MPSTILVIKHRSADSDHIAHLLQARKDVVAAVKSGRQIDVAGPFAVIHYTDFG